MLPNFTSPPPTTSTMDLINKLTVLMKASLAGTEVKNDKSSEKSSRLSHHYLAQCLHKQCDMYELREMCRLQKVELKRGAGKREIIESLIDHLPNVNLEPSPKEVANKTRKMGTKSKPNTSPSPSPLISSKFGDENAHNLKRVPGTARLV